MEHPQNYAIVIFGASGDLTKKKLIPALFELYRQKLLCDSFTILGLGRTNFTDESFQQHAVEAINESSEVKEKDDKLISGFIKNLSYHIFDNEHPDDYTKLKETLTAIDKEKGTNGNYIYYLAVPPKAFGVIARNLGAHNLQKEENGAVRRIIVEKPFGYSYESALKLNAELHEIFNESQIYRIDHYLGKETVQNVLVMRFANGIFEPMWNRNFIDHVEITSAEFIGVENRGRYFEGIGTLRDMIQNHMMQIVGFIAMEPPSSFEADSIRNETLKVFQSLRPIKENEVEKYTVRGQYTSSTVRGERIPGYREEPDVSDHSRTETYAAIKFFIDNWRWGGVPFYIRSGKRLPTRVTEVVIHFKATPHWLFSKFNDGQVNNQLVIRIQPDEGILIKFGMKTPGSGYKVQTVNMDFHYSDITNVNIPAAYERLLLDCMLGDSTLYARADAVEQCWKFVQPVLDAWEHNHDIKIYGYPAGTWGPLEAHDLFENSKTEWRYPCKNLTDDGLYCEL